MGFYVFDMYTNCFFFFSTIDWLWLKVIEWNPMLEGGESHQEVCGRANKNQSEQNIL